jgi:eukaryotic-like serine/threonine-protein kinase
MKILSMVSRKDVEDAIQSMFIIATKAIPGPVAGALEGVAGTIGRKAGEALGGLIFGVEEQLRGLFLRTALSLSAKIMKADGTVSREEEDRFQRALDEEGMDVKQREEYERIIKDALNSEDSFEHIAKDFFDKCQHRRKWHIEMLKLLFSVACCDGDFDQAEEDLIRKAADIFGLTEKEYLSLKELFAVTESDLEESYEILGCGKNDSDQIIRQKYQELLDKYQPEKLKLAGAAEKYVADAEDNLRKVQRAHTIISNLRQIAADTSKLRGAPNPVESTESLWSIFRGDYQRRGVFRTRGVDRQTDIKWKFRASNQVTGSPVVTSDYVIFGSQDKFVYCVEKETGREKWAFRADNQVQASPVAYSGLVYFVCAAGCLYAVEIASGEQRWKFDSRGEQRWKFDWQGSILGAPAICDGRIYFGSSDGFLYSLDILTGEQAWKFDSGKAIGSSPSICEGVIYFGNDNGQLYAVNMSVGQEKWKFKTKQGRLLSSPIRTCASVEDGVVYFGNNDKQFYAVEVKLGQLKWMIEVGSNIRTDPGISQEIILVGSSHLKAVDILAGEVKWIYEDQEITSSPSIAGETVYFGTVQGLHAADVKTGRNQWKFPTETPVVSSPVIADGVIYFASQDGYVYALR